MDVLKAKQSAIPKFIRLLYHMCLNEETESAIGFSSDGKVIEFRDLEVLANEVLPNYFKHNRITSFVRQLNNYGFKSCASREPGSPQRYYHPYFQLEKTESLNLIRRGGDTLITLGMSKRLDSTTPMTEMQDENEVNTIEPLCSDSHQWTQASLEQSWDEFDIDALLLVIEGV